MFEITQTMYELVTFQPIIAQVMFDVNRQFSGMIVPAQETLDRKHNVC
jgi:hypothetical protein